MPDSQQLTIGVNARYEVAMRTILLVVLASSLSACLDADGPQDDPATDTGEDGKADGTASNDPFVLTCTGAPLTQAQALAIVGPPERSGVRLTGELGVLGKVSFRHRLCYEVNGVCGPWKPGNAGYGGAVAVVGIGETPTLFASLQLTGDWVYFMTEVSNRSVVAGIPYYGDWGIGGQAYRNEVLHYTWNNSWTAMKIFDDVVSLDGLLTQHCMQAISKVGKRKTKDALGNSIRLEGQIAIGITF